MSVEGVKGGRLLVFWGVGLGAKSIQILSTLKMKLNFFQSHSYGGKDACTGDSGGPLWKWIGRRRKKAFLIGVVSRGKGCARLEGRKKKPTSFRKRNPTCH